MDHWDKFKEKISLFVKHKFFDPNQIQTDGLDNSLVIWKEGKVLMHGNKIISFLKDRLILV